MKMKFKRIIVAVFAVVFVLTGNLGNPVTVKADEVGPIPVIVNELLNNDDLILTPGQVNHIKLPLRAVGGYMSNVGITVSPADANAPFTISKIELSQEGYTTPVLGISEASTTYVEFDVNVKDTAAIGFYSIKVTVTFNSLSTTYTKELITKVQITKEKEPAQITVSQVSAYGAMVGSDSNIIFKIKNEGEITARNAFVSLDFSKTSIIPKYETPKMKIGDIEPGQEKYLSFPITILPAETAGQKTITVNFDYKNADGVALKNSQDIYIKVTKNDKAPELIIDNVSYSGDLKPGSKVKMIATILNNGSVRAENISIKVDDASQGLGAEGLIKNYFTDIIKVGNIKDNHSLDVEIPFIVSKQATGGMKKINLILSYTDSNGVPYTATIAVYPEIISGATSTDGKSNIIISEVKQSPARPEAGDHLDVSFVVENKSAIDINEMKIYLDGLTGDTFVPLDSEPYKYIDKLAAGEKKTITIRLIVSDNIKEGLNNLNVKYTYISGGNQGADSITIPIHDVQNTLGSRSKPKVIVSKYTTDVDELRAGTTFKFTFDLHNTHSSVAAKNITVTVTQADNVFTVTQGSNSFFIDKIGPGETVENTLEMRVKSDATTKAYPIEIAIDYEYDGAQPNPQTGEVGESKVEKLNLLAVENSRPVIDNINVYSMDGNIMVGNPATLHFEFYNMGKSPLNNVTAYIEGDFTKSDGTMYFVGNVAEGAPAYADFDVIPNVEGTAKGVLRITFEDSNGDQKEIKKEFEAPVNPAGVIANPGMGGDGGAGEVFNPTAPVAKKAILPIWLFIIIQLLIFVLFVPITRKVVINVYKTKKRNEDQDQY